MPLSEQMYPDTIDPETGEVTHHPATVGTATHPTGHWSEPSGETGQHDPVWVIDPPKPYRGLPDPSGCGMDG